MAFAIGFSVGLIGTLYYFNNQKKVKTAATAVIRLGRNIKGR